jgi:hypothetical protein
MKSRKKLASRRWREGEDRFEEEAERRGEMDMPDIMVLGNGRRVSRGFLCHRECQEVGVEGTYSSLVWLEIDIGDPALLRLLIGLLELGVLRSVKSSRRSILFVMEAIGHSSDCGRLSVLELGSLMKSYVAVSQNSL